jgi:hypothetical protein
VEDVDDTRDARHVDAVQTDGTRQDLVHELVRHSQSGSINVKATSCPDTTSKPCQNCRCVRPPCGVNN